MKKTISLIFLTIFQILLCSCKYDSETREILTPDNMQKSFNVGGITVSLENGLYEKITDTELTNTAERLLYEKYNKEFVCEQYLYYEEFSLMYELTAYPSDNPELHFDLDLTGNNQCEIWYDKYYNELYRKEIDDFVYPAVEPYGIKRENFFIDGLYMVTTPEISEETFKNNSFSVYISLSENSLAEIENNMKNIITDIYHKVNSESDIYVYLCDESVTNPDTFSYNKIFHTYDADYRNDHLSVFDGISKEVWYID